MWSRPSGVTSTNQFYTALGAVTNGVRGCRRGSHERWDPGSLAPSTALEQAAPNPASVIEVLDAIPGAFERAQRGLREAKAGQGIPLDEF